LIHDGSMHGRTILSPICQQHVSGFSGIFINYSCAILSGSIPITHQSITSLAIPAETGSIMPKSALRARMLACRQQLPEDQQILAGNLIQSTLTALPEYESAGSVALYASFRSEVPTGGIIRHALSMGKEVLLPAVDRHGLVFRKISSETDLVTGRYGICEPDQSCPQLETEAIDLFVIPGVAFDMHGHRVGYGKGYYDKTLHRFEYGGKLIGVCYDFQLVEVVAGEPHDVIMDRVITERRIVTPVLLK